jgi:hypothetical protein
MFRLADVSKKLREGERGQRQRQSEIVWVCRWRSGEV